MQIRIAAKKIPSIATPGLGRDLATAMVGSSRISFVAPKAAPAFTAPTMTNGASALSKSIQAASPLRKQPTTISKGLFQ